MHNTEAARTRHSSRMGEKGMVSRFGKRLSSKHLSLGHRGMAQNRVELSADVAEQIQDGGSDHILLDTGRNGPKEKPWLHMPLNFNTTGTPY